MLQPLQYAGNSIYATQVEFHTAACWSAHVCPKAVVALELVAGTGPVARDLLVGLDDAF